MHCVSTYPAAVGDLNLSLILILRRDINAQLVTVDMKIVFHRLL